MGNIKNINQPASANSSNYSGSSPITRSDLSHAMLQTCLERLSIVDRAGYFLAASPSVLEAWQLSESEIVKLTLAELIGESCFQENIEKVFVQALAGESEKVEFWHHSDTGARSSRLYEYNLSPLYSEQSVISGVIFRVVDLTERYRVENELAATKQRMKDFADATSDWHWEMDGSLKFTWISSAYHDFYGMDPSVLYGKPRTPVIESDEEFLAWNHHCNLLKNREPFRDYEFRIKTPDGIGWSRSSGVPVFTEGKFCGYRGTASDITRQKETEIKAMRTELRFMHAIDEFPGAFALYDENECLVVHNRRYQQLHNFTGNELRAGLSYERCLRLQLENNLILDHPPCEEEWVQNRLHRFRNSDEPIIAKKNDNKWYRISDQRLPDGGCLKTMLDITDQKNAELAIKEERNLLRSLIDSIPHLIFAKNLDLEFTVINKATADFLGPSAIHSNQEKPGNDNHASTAYRNSKIDLQVINNQQEVKNYEYQVTRESNGEPVWLSTCKSPLYDTNGNMVGLVGATSDITERKNIETDLIRSQARFRDFAETAADWFWEMDSEGRISYLTEWYGEISGTESTVATATDYLATAEFLFEDAASKTKFLQCIELCEPFSDLEATVYTTTGEPRHFFISGKPWYDENNKYSGFRGAGRDVTKFRHLEGQLSYQASHDDLTGLTNRREFMHRLDQLVALSRTQKTNAVLGYLDLDQFKLINDTAGHCAGDQLLVQVAQLIKSCIRKCDTLSRLGGDEFGILLRDTNTANAEATMRRIISQLEEIRFPWDDNLFSIGGSVGLVSIDGRNHNSAELLSQADLACYSAKDAGRATVKFYHAQNDDIINTRSQLLAAASLTEAIENDRFLLYAQPIFPINQSEQVEVHYEILLRMLDDQDQLIYPGAFIPAAERYDLMAKIDRWVITKSLEQMKTVFHPDCDCGITINLSGQSITDASLAEFVKEQLELHDIAASRICFEITETAAISNFNYAQTFISTLKDFGCTFALDDFGSGLSSFGYLKHLKVEYLKIDGSFIRDIVSDPTDRIMVTSINQVAKHLGMKTIAEFVEDQDIVDVLTEINVDYVQGYAVGKPQEFNRAVMFPGNHCRR